MISFIHPYMTGPALMFKPKFRFEYRMKIVSILMITNENGHAEIEFYNNSYSSKLKVSGAGITANGMPYVLDADL